MLQKGLRWLKCPQARQKAGKLYTSGLGPAAPKDSELRASMAETFLAVRSEPNSAPVRSSNGSNERAKAFCKSSSSLPLCMFDSAESSPELPTIKFCFTHFTKTCQMKCQTVRCEILQSAFISAGGSLSSAGAQLVLQD